MTAFLNFYKVPLVLRVSIMYLFMPYANKKDVRKKAVKFFSTPLDLCLTMWAIYFTYLRKRPQTACFRNRCADYPEHLENISHESSDNLRPARTRDVVNHCNS